MANCLDVDDTKSTKAKPAYNKAIIISYITCTGRSANAGTQLVF